MPSVPVLLCEASRKTAQVFCATTPMGFALQTALSSVSTDAQHYCPETTACPLYLCCSVRQAEKQPRFSVQPHLWVLHCILLCRRSALMHSTIAQKPLHALCTCVAL
ncbi:hypothetical protein ABBQ38_006574 [Trebouxia sp. C0009 RCD-2024]